MRAFVSCVFAERLLSGGIPGRREEKEEGGKKKKPNEGCVRNVVGKACWLTAAAGAAAPNPPGLLHCSTLSLGDVSAGTVGNGKNRK